MIDAIFLGAASALWLGVLASISPCPLATNIAAVSYIGRQYRSPAKVTFPAWRTSSAGWERIWGWASSWSRAFFPRRGCRCFFRNR